MTVAQWASSHVGLLRFMLSVPLLWRIAYRLITENLPHDESGALCIVCAARTRKLKYTHEVVMHATRQLYCKKCGLTMSSWKTTERCSNKKPPYKPEPEPTSQVRVLPMNWD